MDQLKKDLKSNNESRGDLNVLRMLESRIVEIIQIEKEVRKKHPKLFTQRLPRYMRRRAASHNPYRIPKWMRIRTSRNAQADLKAKDRSRLFKYRLNLRHAKHKRVLKRHSRHRYKDPNKSIVHKWFAKRFKMQTEQEGLEWVPIHNNTKNFRNLYRQTRYGCAYLALGHLIAFQIDATLNTATLEILNKFTRSTSGFTFAARSLEAGKYEVVIHLYNNRVDEQGKKEHYHICPAFVSAKVGKSNCLTLWVPRVNALQVQDILAQTKLPFVKLPPRDTMRFRLVGPRARHEAVRLTVNKDNHLETQWETDHRILASQKFGLTIGQFIEEKNVCFTYFNTNPQAVDIVLRNTKEGRMMWNKLVKDRAHLVGGKRDVDELFKNNRLFQLEPDCG